MASPDALASLRKRLPADGIEKLSGWMKGAGELLDAAIRGSATRRLDNAAVQDDSPEWTRLVATHVNGTLRDVCEQLARLVGSVEDRDSTQVRLKRDETNWYDCRKAAWDLATLTARLRRLSAEAPIPELERAHASLVKLMPAAWRQLAIRDRRVAAMHPRQRQPPRTRPRSRIALDLPLGNIWQLLVSAGRVGLVGHVPIGEEYALDLCEFCGTRNVAPEELSIWRAGSEPLETTIRHQGMEDKRARDQVAKLCVDLGVAIKENRKDPEDAMRTRINRFKSRLASYYEKRRSECSEFSDMFVTTGVLG